MISKEFDDDNDDDDDEDDDARDDDDDDDDDDNGYIYGPSASCRRPPSLGPGTPVDGDCRLGAAGF